MLKLIKNKKVEYDFLMSIMRIFLFILMFILRVFGGLMLFIGFFSFVSQFVSQPYAQQREEDVEEKYKEELRRLQKEIEMLKLKILETRKALKNFEDMILLGTLTGTKITIYYKNDLKVAEVQDISVILDGFEVSRIKDEKKIEEAGKKEIVIYDEAEAIPGRHVVDIVFTIKGDKLFKKAIRYEFEVDKNIATIISVKTQKAPASKIENLPEDIDILISSEKVRLITK